MKASELLGLHLNPLMQESWSYIKGFQNFKLEIENLKNITNSTILATVDLVVLYPVIFHESGLKAIKKVSDKRKRKPIFVEDLFQILGFVLEINHFELNIKLNTEIQKLPLALNMDHHTPFYVEALEALQKFLCETYRASSISQLYLTVP